MARQLLGVMRPDRPPQARGTSHQPHDTRFTWSRRQRKARLFGDHG
eukprot:CAMPEP_0170325100 /NCGR_PEP_ID=MMETSP0116_2-20130129/63410_1 /TAXON_ID=400756 /ORGANISM="Durinskia baltica, Strain CSIRO CS-38" /LENGTH=45 /DNA_ID= /DNA_START= /DNA_END= /DNA_ORIENTATION=